jgi:hypothetical protein
VAADRIAVSAPLRNTELAEVAPYADVGESSFINENNLL